MGLFHKQSRWEKLIEPVSHGAPLSGGQDRTNSTRCIHRDIHRQRGRVGGTPAQGEVVKLSRIAIFGIGYVLGTRAGRERYEQIVAAAQRASQRLENYFDGGRQSEDRSTSTDETSDGGSGQQ